MLHIEIREFSYSNVQQFSPSSNQWSTKIITTLPVKRIENKFLKWPGDNNPYDVYISSSNRVFFDNFKTLLSKDFVQRKSDPKNLFANVNTTSSDWTDIATI